MEGEAEMKTDIETKRINAMCMDLTNLMHSAGFRNTTATYDAKNEIIVVDGEVNGKVNVHMSSVAGCLVDIFEQLGPAIRKAAY
jgi:hypothetical protein